MTEEQNKEVNKPGIVFVPYLMKCHSSKINNITVWHSNKFINLLIKIKHFFYTPKALRNFRKYSNKQVNRNFYGTLKINNENEQL